MRRMLLSSESVGEDMEYFVSPYNGFRYKAIEDISIELKVPYNSGNLIVRESNLIELTCRCTTFIGGNNSNLLRESNVERLYLPITTSSNTYIARKCTNLKEVVVGEIGCPVKELSTYSFYECTNAELTITVYVADDAELPLTNHPFGATNATIIYRSATTGEVLEY